MIKVRNTTFIIIILFYSCASQNWHGPSGIYDYKTDYTIKVNKNVVSANGNIIGWVKSIQDYPSQFASKPNQKEINVDSIFILGKKVSLTLGTNTINGEESKVFFIQVEYGKSEFSYMKTKRKIRRTLQQIFQ